MVVVTGGGNGEIERDDLLGEGKGLIELTGLVPGEVVGVNLVPGPFDELLVLCWSLVGAMVA